MSQRFRMIRWFYPGLGVKRWLVVIIVGALFLVNGLNRSLIAEGLHFHVNEVLDNIVDDFMPRVAASLDGGDSFLPSEPLSAHGQDLNKPKSIALHALVTGGNNDMLSGALGESEESGGPLDTMLGFLWGDETGGDTNGIVADSNGSFHAAWVENRTGTPQIWTSSFTVKGRSANDGTTAGAGLSDVSNLVTLDYEFPHYDRVGGTIVAPFRIRNTSRVRIAGPFSVQVISVRAGIAYPRRIVAMPAYLRLHVPFVGQVLLPGARTELSIFKFRVGGDLIVSSSLFDERTRLHLVDFRAKVYGRPLPLARTRA